MEQRLAGMEKAVGELKGLQTQMAEFRTLQNSVVAMLTHMESQISKLELVDSKTDDEEQVEEKDQELGTSQSTGPPLIPVFPSTSHSTSATVADLYLHLHLICPHHAYLLSVRSRLCPALHPCLM